ncbi:MAG: heparinase II/III family protein [Clostridia bacterium]|nr:heparinase II/III family protein [Clostridia bacterium]
MLENCHHPYMYITHMNLSEKAEKNLFLYQPLIDKANQDLLSPLLFPENTEGWLYDILDLTKERILRNCIVYKITKNQIYLDSMKKQLFLLIDQWPWIEKFHSEKLKLNADLRTGIIMFTLGLVYDWMFDDFDMAERAVLYDAITIRGFNLLKKDIRNKAFYLDAYHNNWMAVMIGGYCIAALATFNENDYSKEIYKMTIEKIPKMIDCLGHDGAWEEGPFYWGGISFLIMFLDIMSSVENVPNYLYRESFFKTPLFPIYMNMPPCGRANFSDAHYYQDHNSTHIFATMARLAKNPYYQWAFHEFRTVAAESIEPLKKLQVNNIRPQEETYQFLTYDDSIHPKYPYIYENFKVFQGENYGFISSRTNLGRNDSKTVLCANAGTNGTNHHQLDIGQVIITSHKENFICDPGYGLAYKFSDGTNTNMQNYFAKNSFGHNIVTIGRRNQIDSKKAHGIITEAYRKDDTNYFTIDVTKAYYNVKKAFRKIIHRNDFIIIIDDFSLLTSDEASLRWFFNGNLIMENSKFIIETPEAKLLGEVTSSTHSMVSCSSSFYSDEGCLDRADQLLEPKQYPYMEFDLERSKHHVFNTTFTFMSKA